MISLIMNAVKKFVFSVFKYFLTISCLTVSLHFLVKMGYLTEKQLFNNLGWVAVSALIINHFIMPRFQNILKLIFVTSFLFPLFHKGILIGFEEFHIKETMTSAWIARTLAASSSWSVYHFGSRLIKAVLSKIIYLISFPFLYVGSWAKSLYDRILFRLRGVPPCPINLTMFQIDRFGKGDSYEKGREFEEFIAQMYRILGYNAKTTTQLRKEGKLPPSIQKRGGSGEQGVDVVYTIMFNGEIKKTIVQCKHYSTKVDNKAIQEIVAAKNLYEADHLVVITNNYFTKPARELAESNGVTLIDRDVLPKVIANVTKYYYQQKEPSSKGNNKPNKKDNPKNTEIIEPMVDFEYMNRPDKKEILD